MDRKSPEIKRMVHEPWVMSDTIVREESDSIKPVEKDEGASFRKLGKKSGEGQKEKSAALKSDQVKELSEQIERYLSDIDVRLSFEVCEKTGVLVFNCVN